MKREFAFKYGFLTLKTTTKNTILATQNAIYS